MFSRLHRFLIPATAHPPRRQVWFWLGLSLAFALLYAFLGLRPAFSGDYVVQDDARQHVFWMRRFLDPDLFPNDLIADYFQSTAPALYAGLYRAAATLGIDPLLFNKLLPIALAVLTTLYCFGACLRLLPVPFAAFVAALLLNQNLWLQDDLVSGIARAFVFPIFLAFLYYLLKRSPIPCWVAIALQGLIYPQLVFVMAGVLLLRLIRREHGSWQVTRNRRDYLLSGVGLAVAFAVLLPYALGSSPYAPVVTAAQARLMPEFGEQGRTRLFVSNFWEYWFTEERTGLFVWVMPLCILSIGLLPLMLRWRDRFPLVRRVRHLGLLGQVAIVSLFWFLAAHALLFTLYLPSRYSQNTFQIVTALTGGIAVTVLVDRLLRWAAEPGKQDRSKQIAAASAAVAIGLVLLFSPYLWEFPRRDRVFAVGEYPALYQFFAEQPKDILIASFAREADNLPTFAQRSVLTSREYSIPYHTGYYSKLYERTEDLIRAQYSPDLPVVQDFIRRYGVDFWLIDRAFLRQPYSTQAGDERITLWLQQFQPIVAEVTQRLNQGEVPVVVRRLNRCTVAKERDLVVLSAACLMQGR